MRGSVRLPTIDGQPEFSSSDEDEHLGCAGYLKGRAPLTRSALPLHADPCRQSAGLKHPIAGGTNIESHDLLLQWSVSAFKSACLLLLLGCRQAPVSTLNQQFRSENR